MTSDSFQTRVEAARGRQVQCPSCLVETTVHNRNSEGHWYCRCLSCGCRFWYSDAESA